jgi:hypothetical protein
MFYECDGDRGLLVPTVRLTGVVDLSAILSIWVIPPEAEIIERCGWELGSAVQAAAAFGRSTEESDGATRIDD